MPMGIKRVRDGSTSCLATLKAIQQYARRDNTLLKVCMTAWPQQTKGKPSCPSLVWCYLHALLGPDTQGPPWGPFSHSCPKDAKFNFLKLSGIQNFYRGLKEGA